MEQKSSYYRKQWINKFDLFNYKTNNAQDLIKNKFLDHYPIHYTDDTTDYEQVRQYKDQSKYVWLVDRSITVLKTFPWWFRPEKNSEETVFRFPYVYKQSRRIKDWHKVQLVSTTLNKVRVSKQRYICGEYDPYNGKPQFDIFYLSDNLNLDYFTQLKNKFPNIVLVNDIREALEKSTTDMLWLIPNDVVVDDLFDFSYEPDEWSYNYCHMFQNNNKKTYNGIVLIPRTYEPTGREITYRHFASKKLVNILASNSRQYDKFIVSSYEEFLSAQESSTTSMFWVIPDDVEAVNTFAFDYQIPRWDEKYVHLFLNKDYYNCTEQYNGIGLFSKSVDISKREFENRFYQNKKEIPIIASNYKQYDKFIVSSYEEFLSAQESSTTSMFWIIPSDVEVMNNFDFNFRVPKWDQEYTHVFLNSSSYDGIALFPKSVNVSTREFENRFYQNKKEIPIIASKPKSYIVY